MAGGARTALDAVSRQRRDEWLRVPVASLERSLSEQRWVVVDVESSGLDVRSDSLVAIGAVSVRGGVIDLADSFEVVLRQTVVSSDDNILIHGIAGSEQRDGEPPHAALLDFLDFIGGDPLIAFHAFFDDAMITRACQLHLGCGFRRQWLDLAHLAPALHVRGDAARARPRGLDDWLAQFDISVTQRHRAVADAVATAQLWLALSPALQAAGALRARDAFQRAREQAWLDGALRH